MALLLTADTDVQFMMSEVDVIAVQQFPFPAGGQEDEAGGQTGEEGCPGQEVAVAVEESVPLLHLNQLLHPALHQLDDGQHRDGREEVEDGRQPPVGVLRVADGVAGEQGGPHRQQDRHPGQGELRPDSKISISSAGVHLVSPIVPHYYLMRVD